MTLKKDVPIDKNIEQLKFNGINIQKAISFLKTLEINSLTKRIAVKHEINIDEIYVTQIDKTIQSDTFFPDISGYCFFKLDETPYYTEGDVRYKYELYVKNNAYAEELKAREYCYCIS